MNPKTNPMFDFFMSHDAYANWFAVQYPENYELTKEQADRLATLIFTAINLAKEEWSR